MATAKTEPQDVFETLRLVDVSDHVEEKDTGRAKLKYLSWAWAWHEVRKRYPDANYTIVKNENNLPYFIDPQLGIMVYTTVTIGGETHEMWLPVMDGANNPMRLEPYDIKMKYGVKHVEGATMFDINKTVMRCLTKNLAMFGIGLALYAGEDLFDDTDGNKGVEATSKSVETKSGKDDMLPLEQVRKEIEIKITALSANMTAERKNKMGAWIKTMIGDVDYHKCTNVADLNKMLAELNKMKAA